MTNHKLTLCLSNSASTLVISICSSGNVLTFISLAWSASIISSKSATSFSESAARFSFCWRSFSTAWKKKKMEMCSKIRKFSYLGLQDNFEENEVKTSETFSCVC